MAATISPRSTASPRAASSSAPSPSAGSSVKSPESARSSIRWSWSVAVTRTSPPGALYAPSTTWTSSWILTPRPRRPPAPLEPLARDEPLVEPARLGLLLGGPRSRNDLGAEGLPAPIEVEPDDLVAWRQLGQLLAHRRHIG